MKRYLRKPLKKKDSLFTTDLVIAEVVWVLESFYKLGKNYTRGKLEKILNTPNLTCPNKDLILLALTLYAKETIDFIDAYNALILKKVGISEIYSYDKDYNSVIWLTRLEP